jgi:hypothetical protein
MTSHRDTSVDVTHPLHTLCNIFQPAFLWYSSFHNIKQCSNYLFWPIKYKWSTYSLEIRLIDIKCVYVTAIVFSFVLKWSNSQEYIRVAEYSKESYGSKRTVLLIMVAITYVCLLSYLFSYSNSNAMRIKWKSHVCLEGRSVEILWSGRKFLSDIAWYFIWNMSTHGKDFYRM